VIGAIAGHAAVVSRGWLDRFAVSLDDRHLFLYCSLNRTPAWGRDSTSSGGVARTCYLEGSARGNGGEVSRGGRFLTFRPFCST
jgi:hypothetical protein